MSGGGSKGESTVAGPPRNPCGPIITPRYCRKSITMGLGQERSKFIFTRVIRQATPCLASVVVLRLRQVLLDIEDNFAEVHLKRIDWCSRF